VKIEGEAKCVESRTKIRAGGWDANAPAHEIDFIV
jgi:hypothetical protein